MNEYKKSIVQRWWLWIRSNYFTRRKNYMDDTKADGVNIWKNTFDYCRLY